MHCQSGLAYSPCHLLIHLLPWRVTSGWEFDPFKPVVGVSRRGLWRLRITLLYVASLGWASEHEISSLVGHFTFRALVRRKLLAARRPSESSKTAVVGARLL